MIRTIYDLYNINAVAAVTPLATALQRLRDAEQRMTDRYVAVHVERPARPEPWVDADVLPRLVRTSWRIETDRARSFFAGPQILDTAKEFARALPYIRPGQLLSLTARVEVAALAAEQTDLADAQACVEAERSALAAQLDVLRAVAALASPRADEATR